MAKHAYTISSLLRSTAGAPPPLLCHGADRQPGPVTRAIRDLRPNEMPSWELRQRQMDEEAKALRDLRRRVADAVTAGIDFLDATEGDAELEADYTTCERSPDGGIHTLGRSTDDEPSLCGIGGHVIFGHMFELPVTGNGCGGNQWDLEGENEHGTDEDRGEETLGWCENVGQLALGPNTADGDATALETYGAGFIRSGHEDDEDTHDAEAVNEDGDGEPDSEPSLEPLGGTASSFGLNGFGRVAEQWNGGHHLDLEATDEDGDTADNEPSHGSPEWQEAGDKLRAGLTALIAGAEVA